MNEATYGYTADGQSIRCAGRERSDAIRGRPIAINPLVKLLRKLVPVSTEIMTITRACFNPPSSRSGLSAGVLLETNSASAVAGELVDP